jgi:outer membrane immunogenic protein
MRSKCPGVFLTFALALFVAGGQPAASQDYWSGFSVGIGAGGAAIDVGADAVFMQLGLNGNNAGQSASDTLDFGADETSAFGTVQVAFDQKLSSNFLVGAFADFDFGIDHSHTLNGTTLATGLNGVETNSASSFRIGNSWNVGGRLGYLINEQVLIFATGGYSQLQLDGEAGFGIATTDLPDRLHGYFVGGGLDFMVLPNIILRAEYRYTDYEDDDAIRSVVNATDPNNLGKLTTDATVDADVQSVRGVIVFKLNGNAEYDQIRN